MSLPVDLVTPHMREALANHVLTRIVATPDLQAFELRNPARSAYWTQIIFSRAGIVILGDLRIGGRRGVIGDPYGPDWFGQPLEPDYLAGKFLERTWQPDQAAEWAARRAVELRGMGQIVTAEKLEGIGHALARADLGDEGMFVRSILQAGVRLEDGTPGYGYERGAWGWLVALQARFRATYADLLVERHMRLKSEPTSTSPATAASTPSSAAEGDPSVAALAPPAPGSPSR